MTVNLIFFNLFYGPLNRNHMVYPIFYCQIKYKQKIKNIEYLEGPA